MSGEDLSCGIAHLPTTLYCGALFSSTTDRTKQGTRSSIPTSIASCYEDPTGITVNERMDHNADSFNPKSFQSVGYRRSAFSYLSAGDQAGWNPIPPDQKDKSLYPTGYGNPTLVGHQTKTAAKWGSIKDNVMRVTLNTDDTHWETQRNKIFSGGSINEETTNSDFIDEGMACCSGSYNNADPKIEGCGNLWKGSRHTGICDSTDCDQIKQVYCTRENADFQTCAKDTAWLVRMADSRKLDAICANKGETWRNICACNYPLSATITEGIDRELIFKDPTYPNYKSYLKSYYKNYAINESELQLLAGDPRCFYTPCTVHVPLVVQQAGVAESGGCRQRGFSMIQCNQTSNTTSEDNIDSPITVTPICTVNINGKGDVKVFKTDGTTTTNSGNASSPFYSNPIFYIPTTIVVGLLILATLFYFSSRPKVRTKKSSKML
jgi:hypothetical protein